MLECFFPNVIPLLIFLMAYIGNRSYVTGMGGLFPGECFIRNFTVFENIRTELGQSNQKFPKKISISLNFAV